MAKTVLLDCYVEVNGVEYTDNTSKAEVDDTFEEKETTTFGDDGAKTVLAGLESGSFGWTIKNDFAAAAIDEAMWALRRSLVTVKVRPFGGGVAVSTSNPQYQASILINSWKPISASPGDVAEVDVSYPVSGGWTRTTNT